MTKFAKDVLEIKDNLEKSLESVKIEDVDKLDVTGLKECMKTFHSGIVMTAHVMESVMKRFGIVKYNPINEKFDPNMHEAFLKVEDQSKPENTICTVMQPGYKINKRILRAPKVAVTKKPKS